jgi:hypothetical protein
VVQRQAHPRIERGELCQRRPIRGALLEDAPGDEVALEVEQRQLTRQAAGQPVHLALDVEEAGDEAGHVARDADEQIRLRGSGDARASGLPVRLEGVEELGLLLGEPGVKALRELAQSTGTVEILECETGQAQRERGVGVSRESGQGAHITGGVRGQRRRLPLKSTYFMGQRPESKQA